MIDLSLLRAFEVVARYEGFSAAARATGISQPALSYSVSKLESALESRLFDRVGRSIHMTTAGHALLPRARRMIADADALASDIRHDVESSKVRLRVGAIPTIGPYLLPDAIADLRTDYAEVRVDLHEATTGELTRKLLSNEVHLAIMALPIPDERLLYEELGTESLVLAAQAESPLIEAEKVCPEDLEKHGVVALDELHCLGDAVRGFCSREGIRNIITCHAAQLTTVERLVARGLGVTLVPEISIPFRGGTGVPVGYRRIRSIPPTRKLAAVWHAARERSDTNRALTKRLADTLHTRLSQARTTLPELKPAGNRPVEA